MGNPIYGSNKMDAVVSSTAVQGESPALSGNSQKYITIPFNCVVREIYYQVNTALTTAKSTLVVKGPEGTCTDSVAEIPDAAAIGTGGLCCNLSKNNNFVKGDVIEIENDAAPGAGQVTYVVICESI